MSSSPEPSRGDVWQVRFGPVMGREQNGVRPAVVVSVDELNSGPAELLIVIPMTTRRKDISWHVFVPKGEAGLDFDSYIKVEDVTFISRERLIRYRGDLTYPRIEQLERILRVLLGL
jgi:mRNA interferase MazF